MVLEHIIDDGALTIFFSTVDDHLDRCSSALNRACPRLGREDCDRLLRLLQAYAAALKELADPERAMTRLSALESDGSPTLDLEAELGFLTTVLIDRFAP
jgi:hypothetical protein